MRKWYNDALCMDDLGTKKKFDNPLSKKVKKVFDNPKSKKVKKL